MDRVVRRKTFFVALVVSIGGFLFGFDAGIISGVISYVTPEFGLNDAQTGWAVSSPSFAAMFSMLFAGRLSDMLGRKKILLVVAFLYALSALLSAYASSYEMLYITRMIGGVAFGAALVLAPTYIAEISNAENRGKLVSMQQLNIVLGFFAAFLCNNILNGLNGPGSLYLNDQTVWRWMLGVELFPALLYLILMFFVPRSPRWLYQKNFKEEAKAVLISLHGIEKAEAEEESIERNIEAQSKNKEVSIMTLLKPSLRFVLVVGLILGVIQQVTGINAVYFYATSIFKQTGIGTDAAFTSGVLLSFTTVVFTVLALFLIDRLGRRPLLLSGLVGIGISMLLCAYAFNNATYELKTETSGNLNMLDQDKLFQVSNIKFENDVDFKNAMKSTFGIREFTKNEGAIMEAATTMNPNLVLIGILGFIACFAFSLGPVMWVMLSEMYPNKYRGLVIGVIGFVNSLASWLVQQFFPWELSNLGNAMSFFIFGVLAIIGFAVLYRILPETKGKSLEELEKELIRE
ncbi:sugar porter family MFS transporter [Zobellia galactanivorans]|uniref:Sugars permease n=1 Tax=Zobellia galactanivorans (strain DSM 12802 / CCUG 47099 / CIP 106680 / NCIMB 13871 / Dsij) TaxID=63186 RepID=G0L2B8_ZOBGA|nr:sugar porter family MFS transporter [Zobellia galactanivorans]CAZ98033.1 Sugars permease [Zobellia galactanivorans]